MPAFDHAQASDLLVSVVQKFYSERHSPLPGAFVKAQLLAEAQKNGTVFSERELGFRKFLEFVRTVPRIAIQGRSGSDVLLAPSSAGELLAAYASPLPRLRRDFWRAFIEFPVANTVRLYDPEEDRILYEESGTQRPGVLIEPVSKETQLEWRMIFAKEQPDSIKTNLLDALQTSGTAVFNEFARRLRENPSAMRAWNHYLQKQITDHVAGWVSANKIPGIPYSTSQPTDALPAKPQSISQRAELYNFFDRLPIEDLLQLRVSLEWVLKVTREGR